MAIRHESVGPHGSIWCATHDRWECSRKSKRSQQRCHKPAIRGRDACDNHIGERRSVAKAKGEANVLAYELAWDVTGEISLVGSADVMLRLLHMSWVRVHLLAARLRVLVEGSEGDEGFVSPRDGGEQIRALTRLEAEERDRCARFAKLCHDMRIDERQIELQESQATQITTAVRLGMDAVELTTSQRDAFLRSFLGALGRGPDMPAPAAAAAVVAGEVATS